METREEMINWAREKVGKWTDVDGFYGAQCVDLTMAYTEKFGGFRMYGNAIDYLKNPIPKGWARFTKGETKIEPADIAIWKWSKYDIYGHVGIVIATTGNYITSVEQNVDGAAVEVGGIARIKTRSDECLVGVIRPNFSDDKISGRKWIRKFENGTFIIKVGTINVRTEPTLSAEIVAKYNVDDFVRYDSYVINDGFIWISYISYTGKRRYVATGEHDGTKRLSTWGEFLKIVS